MDEITLPCVSCGAPNNLNKNEQQALAASRRRFPDATHERYLLCTGCYQQRMLTRLEPGLRRWGQELIDEGLRLEPSWRISEWNWKYGYLDIRSWPGHPVLQHMCQELERLSGQVCTACGRDWPVHRRSTCLGFSWDELMALRNA